MKGLFHFILSHSIFISFCALALSLQTLLLLSLPVSSYMLSFIFFATLCGYNAYWMVSRFSFNSRQSPSSFLQKNTSSFLVIIAAFAGMIYCAGRLQLVMYNIVLTGVLLGLYALPVMPFKQLHFIRKAGFLKTILLAFAWAIVTILIPLQTSILRMGHAASLLFVNRFLFMLMLCIIFDKRDAAIDKIRGMQSLATDIKPAWLHCLVGFIFVSYVATGYLLPLQLSLPQKLALIAAGIVTLIVYYTSLKKRGYLFYYFIVDGLMLLSAVLTWLAGLV